MFSVITGAIFGALKATGAFLITPPGIGTGLAGVVATYFLGKIDNIWVKEPIFAIFRGLAAACYAVTYSFGVAVTLGASKWKWTKGFWNKVIEPFVIDLIDNTIGTIIEGIALVLTRAKEGLFNGLRSDNK